MVMQREVVELAYDLPNGQLAACLYPCEGVEQPTVLALHGWLDNAASFSSLAQLIPNQAVLALDLAGHGLSSHKAAGNFYHIWDYALDVVALLEQLASPVILMGHSMGGAVASLVAAISPNKVKSLILLDNVGPLTAQSEDRVDVLQRSLIKMLSPKLERKRPYQTQDEMVLARVNGFTKLTKAAASLLVERSSHCSDGQWFWRHDEKLKLPSPFRMDEESVQSFLQKIQCPVLALFAEQGVYQANKALVGSRMNHIKQVESIWLSGSHHFHLEVSCVVNVANCVKEHINKIR
ncbi:alpha/beta hydrolase [Marinomonas epiphytica]